MLSSISPPSFACFIFGLKYAGGRKEQRRNGTGNESHVGGGYDDYINGWRITSEGA
jgi:hypothetical protein